jgi:hypothetical protein
MSNNRSPETGSSQHLVYQIWVKGHLGHQWTDWFEGLPSRWKTTAIRC